MAKPGRKSAAALEAPVAVVVNLPGQRHAAPKGLTSAQAAIWRAVVATKPADWFGRDTHPLLSAYCRHVTAAEMLGKRIDQLTEGLPGIVLATGGLELGLLKELLKMRDRETRAIAALARSMRLTQQSRYTPHSAAGKAAATARAPRRPWEKAAG